MHAHGATMKKLHRLLVLLVIIGICGTNISSKCVTARITVEGTVNNLPNNANGIEVRVTVETAQGKIVRTARLSPNAEFAVDVPFSTYSSTVLGGDRCKSKPKSVEVALIEHQSTYMKESFNFGDAFEEVSPHSYHLRQKLVLDAAKR